MKKNSLIILSAFFIFFSYAAAQTRDISKVGPVTEKVDLPKYNKVFYISQKFGSDKEGNGTKIKPWATVTFALNKIQNNSDNNKTALLVAEGEFKSGTLKMKSFVDIFGGFKDGTWDRDIYNYPTVFDGDYSRRVVIGADDARIDGVTITKGISCEDGGGMLCDDTSPEISNCFIVNNYALEPKNFNYTRIHQKGNEGGGIACLYNGIPIIRNCIFYKNRTSIGDGGALSFYGWVRERHGTDRRIENNFMEGSGRAEVRNNVFIQNIAGVNDIDRTRSSNGGAISCSSEARPIIENNVITCNLAKGNSDAGGIYVEDFSYPTVNGNWIVGNITDDDGGGMYIMRTSHPIITNNYIAGNWTINGGAGGIRLSKEGRATISENIIVDNQSGGGIQCIDSYMELKNNVIMGNKGKTSIRYSNVFSYFIPTQIENNIILDNQGKITIELKKDEVIRVDNNDVKENVIGENNTYKSIKLNTKTISGEIKNYSFDEKNYQTVVETKNLENTNSLEGRVFRAGNFWSVIEKVDNDKLYIWGNLDERASKISEFLILPSYTK